MNSPLLCSDSRKASTQRRGWHPVSLASWSGQIISPHHITHRPLLSNTQRVQRKRAWRTDRAASPIVSRTGPYSQRCGKRASVPYASTRARTPRDCCCASYLVAGYRLPCRRTGRAGREAARNGSIRRGPQPQPGRSARPEVFSSVVLTTERLAPQPRSALTRRMLLPWAVL